MSKNKKNETSELLEVKEQYQDYPYPYRNPSQELQNFYPCDGEYLAELNHYLYRGKKNFDSNFRCLVAGGGTGDAVMFLGEQLKNTEAEIVYLDFSKASMEIAMKRAEVRGIKNVTFINDSIMNIPKLNLGIFDYINCSGVLHHLENPPAALQILKDSLTETGGMFLMIYATYGRTGIYQTQKIMQMVNEGVNNRIQEIMNGKAILGVLPPTSAYGRYCQTIPGDQVFFGDAGLYDSFLHKQDRSYSIPEMYEFVANAGLNFVDFALSRDRLKLRIENYIRDFSLLEKIKKMDVIKQRAICELIVGDIVKHIFYVSNQKDSIATLSDLDNVPYFTIRSIPKLVFDSLEANPNMTNFNLTINNTLLQNVIVNLPVSIYTKDILRHMLDESKSFGEIFDAIRQELKQDIPDKVFIREITHVFSPLLLAGIMLLRDKSIKLPMWQI